MKALNFHQSGEGMHVGWWRGKGCVGECSKHKQDGPHFQGLAKGEEGQSPPPEESEGVWKRVLEK